MLPVHSEGRPTHRRACLQNSGAFTSLGALPRRTRKPTFHFNDDDGSSSTELSPIAVPFPRTSPLHSPSFTKSPTVLKPLKSSLKSSSSSPNIPFPAQSLVPSIMFPDLHPKQQQHQRASSAPSTPLFNSSSPSPPSTSSSSTTSSPPPFHHVPKNVHFPSQEEGGLATIRVFNRSARPASLSRLGEETETDTDGEVSSSTAVYGGNTSGGWQGWSGKYVGGSTFPFPRVAEKKSPLNPSKQKRIQYNIDWSVSSVIPRKNVDRGFENVFFETLQVIGGSGDEMALQGSLLVRNITYQKTVMVRFTMDEWETVNDVMASYDGNGKGWDRFKFSISLGGQGLQERVVWFVGKYAGGAGVDAVEWWDNNEGKNYRAGFKEVQEERTDVYKRGVVVSAPTTYACPTPISTPARPKPSDPHQAAITQSTLARLKKLNLKNYAAPRGYAYGQSPPPKLTPPVLTLTSASPKMSFVRPSGSPPPSPLESRTTPHLSLNTTSLELSSPTLRSASTDSTTTSTDSTPPQTPTHGGDDDDGEEAAWKVGGEEEERLRWSLGMENGHFATTLIPSPISSPTTTTTPLSSPIPVSIAGDRNTFSYPKPGGVEMGTSPPFSDLKETVNGGGGFVYWDWGTAAGAALRGGKEEVKKNEESAYDPTNMTNGGGGSGLMPPQRRRGLQQRRGSGTSSSSGSDSSSKLSSLSTTTTTTTPSPPTASIQRPKPPKLTLPILSSTPPIPPPGVISPSSVQSPNIRRGSGQQPQRHGHRHYQSMPSFLSNSKSPSSPGDSDAIYQALVREWCFAQGPTPPPSTRSSFLLAGDTTPVLVGNNSNSPSPSPLGLTCALGGDD